MRIVLSSTGCDYPSFYLGRTISFFPLPNAVGQLIHGRDWVMQATRIPLDTADPSGIVLV